MNFAGINGERADAIMRVLERDPHRRLEAYDIVEAVRNDGHDDLLRCTWGNVEAFQAVLRALEADGKIDRVRAGRRHLWGVRDEHGTLGLRLGR